MPGFITPERAGRDAGSWLLESLADHGGDTVATHGHAVEAVSDLHGAFLVVITSSWEFCLSSS